MLESLLIVALAAWLLIALGACFGVYLTQRTPPPEPLTNYGPAVLIVPVRGVPAGLNALWHGICTQTYSPLRVIFAIESEADPAYAALRALTGGPPVEIVVAGLATERSQKVHNQLAALRRLQPEDAVVVFADADIAPVPNWIAYLIHDLGERDFAMTSGYRWMVPADDRWSTAFVCVANSSVASLPRSRRVNLVWGGSMALRRHSLERLDLERLWARAVSDDLTLVRAMRARDGMLRRPRRALVPAPVSYDRRDAIEFGRRQYLLLRMHAPGIWMLAAACTTVPLVGWAVALPLAFGGDATAIAVIVAANALDQVRASLRRRIPQKLFGAEIAPRVAFLDRFATPAYLAFHAAVIWSTLFGRTITWAGRSYRLDSRLELSRDQSRR
jgi:hypothetical protein